jgi:hypothetical protein
MLAASWLNIIDIFATQPEIWYDGSTYWRRSARSERFSMRALVYLQAAEDIDQTQGDNHDGAFADWFCPLSDAPSRVVHHYLLEV